MTFDREMMKALEADGEKLRQLTGEDHGPWLIADEQYPGQAPCPHCFESSGYAERVHSATWYEPAWADGDPTRPCPYCNATGTVDSPLATLEDLEELAAEEGASRCAAVPVCRSRVGSFLSPPHSHTGEADDREQQLAEAS